jgi:hypothetical protein
MFVPVSCTSCGKPFQVPETALGKLAPCPWCQSVVTALPVATPQPDTPAPPIPLSLDDAPEPAPAQKPAVATPVAPPSTPAPAARSRFPVATVVAGVAIVVVVTAATVLALGYRSGRLPDADWTEFTPPDGSFTVSLPGRPTETDLEPLPEGSLGGGKRYAVRRWYARTAAWVAYHDLEPGLVKKLPDDRTRVITAGVLRVARDREVARLQGTITKEAEIRLDAGWGVEVHLDTPDGPAAIRLVLMGEGKNPRLYAVGVQGKNLTPTNPAGGRLFASFRVNN